MSYDEGIGRFDPPLKVGDHWKSEAEERRLTRVEAFIWYEKLPPNGTAVSGSGVATPDEFHRWVTRMEAIRA